LKSCLDILINKAKQFNEIYIPEDVESKLRKISAATIDRMLKDELKRYELKGRTKTKPGRLLKKQIPIHNYAGYNRYDTDKELFILNELYFYLDRYLNFFQPQMKLIEKKRIGSKMVKKYDNPQTPYQRLLLCEEINDEKKKELKLIYEQLNPFEINRFFIDKCKQFVV